MSWLLMSLAVIKLQATTFIVKTNTRNSSKLLPVQKKHATNCLEWIRFCPRFAHLLIIQVVKDALYAVTVNLSMSWSISSVSHICKCTIELNSKLIH